MTLAAFVFICFAAATVLFGGYLTDSFLGTSAGLAILLVFLFFVGPFIPREGSEVCWEAKTISVVKDSTLGKVYLTLSWNGRVNTYERSDYLDFVDISKNNTYEVCESYTIYGRKASHEIKKLEY